MNLFRMEGSWGALETRLYERVVAEGSGPLYDRFVAEVAPLAAPGTEVLDLGCGAGRVAVRLAAARPDLSVTGVDLSKEMVRRAVARAERRGLANVRFLPGDAMALDFADARFSLACSVASIKHWPDPARGLGEMARVVAPAGGRVVVLEADRDTDRRRARAFCAHWKLTPWFMRPVITAYFRRIVAAQGISAGELLALFEAAALLAPEIRAEPDLPFVLGTARRG